jgi:O-antigen/teichoic acid export membrane protein
MVFLNKLITKSISLLIICFGFLTLLCWLGVSNSLSYFLPEKFLLAIPFFNILMLSSIILPFTLLNTTVIASGKPEIVAKYTLFSFPFWLGSYYIIGNYFKEYEALIALPYFVFTLVLSLFLFRYANKHYQFKPKQIFRSIPDAYSFISTKNSK